MWVLTIEVILCFGRERKNKLCYFKYNFKLLIRLLFLIPVGGEPGGHIPRLRQVYFLERVPKFRKLKLAP